MKINDAVNTVQKRDGYIVLFDAENKRKCQFNYSLQGLNQHISTIISSQYWLTKIFPTETGIEKRFS